jgi:hypothetical protein
MHEQVALPRAQRLAQAGREDAGATELREGCAVDVALGHDGHELHRDAGRGGDRLGHMPGLGERERAAPGTEPQGHRLDRPRITGAPRELRRGEAGVR